MNQDILQSKTHKVYKNEKLNQATFGNFSHTDYQIFLLLISKIGGVDNYGKYLQPTDLKREHILKATEIDELFSVGKNNCYQTLKKACKKLMNKTLVIEKPELKETWEISVCSMAKYSEGEGKVTIKFTDDIMPYLAQVRERFLLYNLKEISSFSSLYTTRLYELLQEFKETGWMIKSLDQLRSSFATGSKFAKYGNFKQRTFAKACDEINKYYAMELQFEEIKEGKKVVAIKFIFKPTIIHQITNAQTGITKNFYEKPQKLEVKKKRKIRKKKTSKKLIMEETKTKKNIGFLTSLFEKFKRRKDH